MDCQVNFQENSGTKLCGKCGKEKPLDRFYCTGGRVRNWCKKCMIIYNAQYNKRLRKPGWVRKTPQKYLDRLALYRKNNPAAIKTHQITTEAIASGLLTRPAYCTGCGRNSRIVAHHDDYNKPLDATWLCYSCHRSLHAQRGQLLEVAG